VVHQVVKPEKIAATAAVLLEQQLIVPGTFRREGIDQFKGAADDTINIKVEGVLPFRTYGWRNDRSTEIQFDTYAERKIAITFGGDIYSGVKLTDEQNEFDLPGWAKLARKQTEAISRGLEHYATEHLLNAPYAVTLGVASTALRSGLIRARAIQTPTAPRARFRRKTRITDGMNSKTDKKARGPITTTCLGGRRGGPSKWSCRNAA
jgi:hypothetical protein